MTQNEPSETLPDEARLALAYTAPGVRAAFKVLLEFDARLSRLVAATTEPMLGQMRLAWWRETLAEPFENRPQGDAVLDAVGHEWRGEEAALVAMVDGWEHMLADPPLTDTAARGFSDGRGAGFAALAGLADLSSKQREAARLAGRRWALADAAIHVADAAERAIMLDLAGELDTPKRLDRPLRGVAVLGALADRSIRNGGRPLMEGRGAALVALRAGLAGR